MLRAALRALHNTRVFERVMGAPISRVRARMSHSDDHGVSITYFCISGKGRNWALQNLRAAVNGKHGKQCPACFLHTPSTLSFCVSTFIRPHPSKHSNNLKIVGVFRNGFFHRKIFDVSGTVRAVAAWCSVFWCRTLCGVRNRRPDTPRGSEAWCGRGSLWRQARRP